MTRAAITFADQALEAELCARGHASIVERALAGKIKRAPAEIERFRERQAVCEATARLCHELDRKGA